MIIKKINVKKFRGFEDVDFELGSSLTAIAGQNGTQKTTLLGLLSQPFSITDKNNPMYNEKPLCGGNYKSQFSDKFKLSLTHDKAKEHEWTLSVTKPSVLDFTVESIYRDKTKGTIRFWQKGKRSKDDGYVQIPVIYLSLSRLLPLGEEYTIKEDTNITLTADELNFLKKYHSKIMITPGAIYKDITPIISKQKKTAGVSTDLYDYNMNSAGQDNLSKILLAILSFRRLKEKYKEYEGGILAIDELDATLYPASQIKLLEALRKFATDYSIQIIFTTHSLGILENGCILQESKPFGQTKVIYLKTIDNKVKAINNIGYNEIKNHLNVAMSEHPNKIVMFREDKEAELFLKCILDREILDQIDIIDVPLGCGNLLQLVERKVPCFVFPNALILLDGDVKSDSNNMTKISKMDNILLLPGKQSPERLIAELLFSEKDDSSLWDNIGRGYNKQIAFKKIEYKQINENREIAKMWFNEQKTLLGDISFGLILKEWIAHNSIDTDQFNKETKQLLLKFRKSC